MIGIFQNSEECEASDYTKGKECGEFSGEVYELESSSNLKQCINYHIVFAAIIAKRVRLYKEVSSNDMRHLGKAQRRYTNTKDTSRGTVI